MDDDKPDKRGTRMTIRHLMVSVILTITSIINGIDVNDTLQTKQVE